MDITNCTKEELAQAVLELTIELGKTRRALNAALKNANKVLRVEPSMEWKKPHIENPLFATPDPMAVDPRSVV
jgi:hypothetical protein